MTIVAAGRSRTVTVDIGGTLTIAAGSGTGTVTRLSNPRGGEPYTPVVYSGAPLTFGPLEVVSIYDVRCDTLTMDYGIARLDGPAPRPVYTRTVREGQTTTIFIPAGATLTLAANANGLGVLDRIQFAGFGEPDAPIFYTGSQIVVGPFPTLRIYRLRADSGPIRFTTAYYIGSTVILALSGPLAFAAGATPGTLVANIGNVPNGATPSVTPNDGRFVVAGDAQSGWKVVVGLAVTTAGQVNLTVSAPGAVDASAVVTISAGDITLAHLNTEELAYRNDFIAAGWIDMPDTSKIVWDDTITVTSTSQFRSWAIGTTAINGVLPDPTRNQRVLFASGGDFTFANRGGMDGLRGRDYLANGKVLLIDGQGQFFRSNVTVQNCRGVLFRNITFDQTVSDRLGDTEFVSGVMNAPIVTNGGAGFVVGDLLNVPANGAIFVKPVLRVTSIGANGAITAVAVDDRGITNSNNVSVAVTSATGTGAVLSLTRGSAPTDVALVLFNYSATYPNMFSVAWFDNCDFGALGRTENPSEFSVCVQANLCEQIVFNNCRMKGFKTGLNFTNVRRTKRVNCDFQRNIGDCAIVLNKTASTAPYSTLYPDGFVYFWTRLCTMRDMFDDKAGRTTGGKLSGWFLEHADGGQCGTDTDTGGYKRLDEFNALYGEAETFYDAPDYQGGVRYGGGMQASWNSDANVSALSHSNIYISGQIKMDTVSGPAAVGYARRNTLARSRITPNGTLPNSNYDYAINYQTQQGASAFARDCIATTFLADTTSGTVGDPNAGSKTSLVTSGNIIADPRAGVDVNGPIGYNTVFTGTFQADPANSNRTTLVSLDVPGDTVAQFRARVWAQYGSRTPGKGALDPALWPAS